MAYTALEKMRKKLEREFGRDVGPLEPWLASGAECGFDLKSAALRFIHNSCEGLRFDACIEEEEKRTGKLQGTSLSYGQIPYNMQMDINRLCLERELERFIDSGATQDAYDVYYCFTIASRRSSSRTVATRKTGGPARRVRVERQHASDGTQGPLLPLRLCLRARSGNL